MNQYYDSIIKTPEFSHETSDKKKVSCTEYGHPQIRGL